MAGLIERIEEYGIDPDSAEGIRERLAYGKAPNLVAHPDVPTVETAKAKNPNTGEWEEL